MRVKRVVFATVLVLVLTVSTPIVAQGAAPPDPDLEIWVYETGEIELCAGPLLCADGSDLSAILADYQIGVLPDFQPLYEVAQANNIDVLVISKQGQTFDLGVNGEQMAVLQIEPVALEELSSQLLSAKLVDVLMPWLVQGELTAAVYFGDGQLGDLEEEEMANLEPVNVVETGVTISPTGEVVSLGGVQPNQLGLGAMYLSSEIMEWFEQFGVQTADLQVSGNVASLAVNGDQWLKATLDASRLIGYGANYMAALPPEYEDQVSLVTLVTSWVLASDTSLHLSVGEEASEVPKITLGRPIIAQVSEDGMLSVEGIALPVQVPEIATGLLGDGLVITLDGPAGQVRSSGELEIALNFEPGFIEKTGEGYLPDLDSEWVEQLVRNTTANLEIIPVGSAVSLQPAEFVDIPSAAGALEIPISFGSDGSLSFCGERLPEQPRLAAGVKALIPWIQPLKSVSIYGNGVMVDVDGSKMSLFLGGETRRDLLVWAVDGLPLSETIVKLIERVLELTSSQVMLSFYRLDTPVPPGPVELWIKSLLGY